MKQAWVDKKEQERQAKIEKLTNEIREAIAGLGDYNETEVQAFIEQTKEMARIGLTDPGFMMPHHNKALNARWKDDPSLWMKTRTFLASLPYEELLIAMRYGYDRYLDSKPKHFHGDIIITDPCYVIKDEDWGEVCNHIDEPDYEPLPGAISRDTIYGDWSCTTYDRKTKKVLGHFCADAGLVAVFDLAEVLKYNPDFDYHIEREWTTTLIKNFDGDVWFEVKYHNTKYGDDYSVHVIGKGTNIKTGEPISFRTTQTGL